MSFAQSSGNGLGIIVGEPTGIQYKSWINTTKAFDVAVAWSGKKGNDLYVHADYLIHTNTVTNKPKIPFYYGFGARVGLGDDVKLGIRGVAGIDFYFDNSLDLFIEIAPVFNLTPSTAFDVNGAIGLRYFF